jgi:CheY-like chemotaxis protein
MSDIDGLMLLRELRADPDYHDTPIIVFSGSRKLAWMGRKAGAQAAFVKGDVPWDHFLAHVDRAMAA